jgi:hypothetical protein
MFEDYSTRSKLVLFLARLESGARGAEMLHLDDLLTGLIIEDQNAIPSALAKHGMGGELMVLPQHQPFLPADAATSALEMIHESASRSEPISQSKDMPISPDLRETLTAASNLKKELNGKEVTPLHLLTVMLRGSHSAAQAFRDVGITEEKILTAIRKEVQGVA